MFTNSDNCFNLGIGEYKQGSTISVVNTTLGLDSEGVITQGCGCERYNVVDNRIPVSRVQISVKSLNFTYLIIEYANFSKYYNRDNSVMIDSYYNNFIMINLFNYYNEILLEVNL